MISAGIDHQSLKFLKFEIMAPTNCLLGRKFETSFPKCTCLDRFQPFTIDLDRNRTK